MSKDHRQEMLELLTTMSSVAAQILKTKKDLKTVPQQDVENLLNHLKTTYAEQ